MSNKNNSNKFVTVVVLNDGETFTDISGCSICIVPLEQYEEVLESGGDARHLEPVVEIGLDNMTIPYPQDDDGEILDDSRQFDAPMTREEAIENWKGIYRDQTETQPIRDRENEDN